MTIVKHSNNNCRIYAKDLWINLGVITFARPRRTATQAWTVAVASAVTTGNREVIAEIEADAAPQLDATALVSSPRRAALRSWG